MINKIKQIKTDGVLWLHVSEPGEQDIQFLRENFEFHPLDLEDCLNQAQRPKLDEYAEYIFVILLFPYYDRRERKILSAEIDFFIGEDFLVTLDDGKHDVARLFFEECIKSQVLRERYLMSTAAHLLFEVLRRLQNSIFPMLDHVSKDITGIESQIFLNRERVMVRDILLMKRNIVTFRRIMNAHRNIIRRMLETRVRAIIGLSNDLAAEFETVLDRTKEIWEIIEINKETIDALQETNDALISFKLNDIMRILTMISVTIFPATLFAALFSTHAANIPIVGGPYDFWIILFCILLIMGGFTIFFKKKNWF